MSDETGAIQGNKIDGGTICSEFTVLNSLAPERYFPLVLRYQYPSFDYGERVNRRSWELQIQSKPESRVIFTGDEPTIEEMVQVLSPLPISVVMVDVFMVICKDAIARNK